MKLKKILSVVTSIAIAACAPMFALACGQEDATPTNTDEYNIPQDYYRTYYEVFIRSFSDSDGDGIGDIQGLINNLDYLNDGDDSTTEDLGINGIWMMPINSSPSYHKYDVTDYYNIDDEYGTLDDFKELVRECNSRDIWLQMDLVLNHTSSQHPWFLQAVKDAQSGLDPEDSEAMQKYVFVRAASKTDLPTEGTYRPVAKTADMYYLGNFSESMPDLNLENEEVRDEIKKIVDYWLDLGVKSFRLDAVPWACANSVSYTDENAEFWTWFNNYCNEKGAEVAQKQGWASDGISAYCYNVGEVWGGAGVVTDYFVTGMSNFNYSYAGNGTAGFAGNAQAQSSKSVAANLANNMANTQADAVAKDPNAILSNFLTNHDNDRLAAMYPSTAQLKSAGSLYMLMPGNCYIYYGEELGAMGTGSDENRRLSFNWGDKSKGITNDPPGALYSGEQTYGTWKEQTEKASSILTYYRNVIKLRNRFPEIARGTMTAYAIDASGKLVTRSSFTASSTTEINELNRRIAAYTLSWNNSTVLIVHNLGDNAEVSVSDFGGYDLVGSLIANKGSVKLSGGTLALPANSVAVLKA